MNWKALIFGMLLGFLVYLPFYLHGETIELDVINPETGEKVELVIPDDHDALRSGFIKMSTLYLEERFDHEASLEQVDDLIDDNISLIDDLRWTSDQLIEWIDKKEAKPDLFQVYLLGDWQKNLLGDQTIGLGAEVVLFEKLGVGIMYELPTSVQIIISGRVY